MSIYNHFIKKAQSLGLHFDAKGTLAGRFQSYCRERDSMEESGHGFGLRLDSLDLTPQSFRLDSGEERTESSRQARARAIK